jgi:RHS repeat-associated protein
MNSLRDITGRALTYSDEDHLLTAGTTTYQYDVDGFLTTKTNGTDISTYSYSSRGELLSATLPDSTVIEYIHDPLGRRIAKKVNGAITEKYLWQGLTRLLAMYDGSDNLIMRFEYADGRMPVAMTRGGSTYYLTYDQVGSLRIVADASGNVVKKVDYDSFGNIISDSDPIFEIPFGFAGGLHDRDTGLVRFGYRDYDPDVGLHDRDTGLVRFGYRDYDPDVGRWTAKDPILFAGGDTDLYGYCLNDPVNWVDPEGTLVFAPLVYFAAAKVIAISTAYLGTKLAQWMANTANPCEVDVTSQNEDINTALKMVMAISAGEIGAVGLINLGVAAGPHVTTSLLSNPAVIQNAADFVQGAIPGTAPPPSIGGTLGAAANVIYNELF